MSESETAVIMSRVGFTNYENDNERQIKAEGLKKELKNKC
jgi:hypothetical protein